MLKVKLYIGDTAVGIADMSPQRYAEMPCVITEPLHKTLVRFHDGVERSADVYSVKWANGDVGVVLPSGLTLPEPTRGDIDKVVQWASCAWQPEELR